ncbi:hypothetical protein FGIG_10883 [Fasciola gigantica]|uniref:Uncharacterized protein n=1 Tax=Fasciola gigantica TaxID=46835 RepID=A0A504YI15_FASGI|nr:hypothetical protein FGIG_10883 [Fasciola gigantica]
MHPSIYLSVHPFLCENSPTISLNFGRPSYVQRSSTDGSVLIGDNQGSVHVYGLVDFPPAPDSAEDQSQSASVGVTQDIQNSDL